MARILLLTKNILAEQRLQEKLQRLNYEVFCTSESVPQLQARERETLLHHFQLVFLSETLCQQEVFTLCDFLKEYSLAVLREVETIPTQEEKQEMQQAGISDWVYKNGTVGELREILHQNQLTSATIFPFPQPVMKEGSLSTLFDIRFARLERQLLQILFDRKEEVVSRSELCSILWGGKPTASNMSQLSSIVNRLKRKFEEQGFQEKMILTYWGNGYQLSPGFCKELAHYAAQQNGQLFESKARSKTE